MDVNTLNNLSTGVYDSLDNLGIIIADLGLLASIIFAIMLLSLIMMILYRQFV